MQVKESTIVQHHLGLLVASCHNVPHSSEGRGLGGGGEHNILWSVLVRLRLSYLGTP